MGIKIEQDLRGGRIVDQRGFERKYTCDLWDLIARILDIIDKALVVITDEQRRFCVVYAVVKIDKSDVFWEIRVCYRKLDLGIQMDTIPCSKRWPCHFFNGVFGIH